MLNVPLFASTVGVCKAQRNNKKGEEKCTERVGGGVQWPAVFKVSFSFGAEQTLFVVVSAKYQGVR